MRYIPLTEDDRIEMLKAAGISSIEQLFEDIPKEVTLNRPLNLPKSLTEPDLIRVMQAMMDKNASCLDFPCFLGAGAYKHFIPSLIPALGSRSEFVTAYTPYQPEISQGTLQAIFEYQTMMSQLTGMPVSNASMYDGAMAVAEAALMANRIGSKNPRIAVSRALHPNYRIALKTYTSNLGIQLEEIPVDENGQTSLASIQGVLTRNPAGIIVQSPNFLGVIENLRQISSAISEKALLIVAVTEALSMGILKSPGECGADIVCGEAQSLGLPLSFGGPYLGFFTAKEKYTRHMPGRLVGMTQDTQGRTGFVNTLSTREQHIRREKATSNICSNQALMATMAGIYMAAMGRQGLREVAESNIRKCAYLKSKISKIAGVELLFKSDCFNEFAIKIPGSANEFCHLSSQAGMVGGFNLSEQYPEYGQCLLLCATEMNTREQIDRFSEFLKRWAREVRS